VEITHKLKKTYNDGAGYSPKMVQHLSCGPTLTKEEYEAEQSRLLFHSIDSHIEEVETFWHEFIFQTTLNNQTTEWTLRITGYEIYFYMYQDDAELFKLLNDITHLYSFYEFLYQNSSTRTKILLEFGPKISFEVFKQRRLANENWK